MTDPKPKKESRRRSRAKRESNPTQGPPKYDWAAIRRAYIRGEDSVTLDSLGHDAGAPKPGTIKNRAAREDWTDLRAQFREQVVIKTREIDLDLKAEVRGRHAKVGKALITLGVRGLAHQQPEKLEPVDVVRLLKIGTDIERKALGMEEVNVRVGRIKNPDDLDKLSEAELWQIAGVLPPEEGDDDEF
ncbi:hypothetical protein GCM10022631_01860 [Deinococcus rubellus]|uniref:Terminase small subunit n=1 Tax=Deinococcus rubellus TaxID=1889240 RepID=A0ABY5YKY8_9DEIO|nr:hypothetical protein [Deinococcus rubellus]UWX64767.1 hypothetical protein N0D28_03650 [Deinococcus rubellus]